MGQNIGKVGLSPQGKYESGRTYVRLMTVSHNGNYWVAVKDVPANAAPYDGSAYWHIMAERGIQGPQGQSYVDREMVPIVDNLTQGGSANVLSAEQGKILKQELTELETEVRDIRDVGTNLVNLIIGKYLDLNGNEMSASESWGISDYISVNGHNIISNAMTSIATIASYVVYDNSLKILRVVFQNAQYTYQDGDAFVRFTFTPIAEARANYGTILKPYEPYTETSRLDLCEDKIKKSFEEIATLGGNKADKDIGVNLVNLLVGQYVDIYGNVVAASNTWGVSGLICVNKKDIISNALTSVSSIPSYVVYDAEITPIRIVTQNAQYTYQDGDVYVRFNFTPIAQARANYGTTLQPYQPYTETMKLDNIEHSVLSSATLLRPIGLNVNLLRDQEVQINKYWDQYGNMVDYTGTGYFGAYDEIGVLPKGSYMIANATPMFSLVINAETNELHTMQSLGLENGIIEVDFPFYIRITTTTKEDASFAFYKASDKGGRYVVGKGGDYDTINEAIAASQDGDTIYVLSGTYRENIALWNTSRHLIGENRDTTIIIDSSGNYDTPPIEMSEGSLSNFTVIEDAADLAEGEQCWAYCLHIEWTPRKAGLCLEVDNCTFINKGHSPLGCGLYADYTVRFRNCTFRCDAESEVVDGVDNQRGSFYFHSNIGENVNNQRIIAENCIISSANTKAVLIGTPYAARGGDCRYQFVGCTIWSDKEGATNSAVLMDKGNDATITKKINSYGNTIPMLNSTMPNTAE